jgi:hypothetical protein
LHKSNFVLFSWDPIVGSYCRLLKYCEPNFHRLQDYSI